MTLDEFTNVIKQVEIFKDLDYEADFTQQLFAYCKIKTFRKNTNIITEGEFGDTMFIALSGTLEIVKRTLAGDSYTVSIVDCETTHPFFGEIALIDGARRSATVRVTQDSNCLIIHKEQFEKITTDFPLQGLYMIRKVALSLSQNLRKTTQDMLTLFNALIIELSGR